MQQTPSAKRNGFIQRLAAEWIQEIGLQGFVGHPEELFEHPEVTRRITGFDRPRSESLRGRESSTGRRARVQAIAPLSTMCTTGHTCPSTAEGRNCFGDSPKLRLFARCGTVSVVRIATGAQKTKPKPSMSLTVACESMFTTARTPGSCNAEKSEDDSVSDFGRTLTRVLKNSVLRWE